MRTRGVPVDNLEAVIRERRSIRIFLPDRPVARELVDDAVDLAIRAPSNSNIQPWHLVFVSGAARDRLVAALLQAAPGGAAESPRAARAFHAFSQRDGQRRLRGRWGLPATTPTAGAPRCCATGSS